MANQGIVFSPTAAQSSSQSAPAHKGVDVPHAAIAAGPRIHERVLDVAEVTFGRAFAEAVAIGDNRKRVRDTTLYPMRAIAYLRVKIAGQVFGATGWFAGPRTVITAGHVVYTHDASSPARTGWVGGIEVMPGYDAGVPHFQKADAVQFSASEEWVASANTAFDYGAIFLAQPLGDTVGMFGFASRPDAVLRNAAVSVAGYPIDRPDPAEPDGALWLGSDKVSDLNNAWVRYPITTTRGQSGSPVFEPNGGSPTVVGIHAYGSVGSNIGMRINDRVFEHIQKWRQV